MAWQVVPAKPEDEDFAYECEISYFSGCPSPTVEEMRAAWVGPGSWPRREFRARSAEGRVIAVPGDASAPLIGFLRWDKCANADCACGGSAACIGHVFVDPACRRRGVGSALLRHFFDAAAEAGFEQACLSVEGWNHGARATYLSAGYTPAGVAAALAAGAAEVLVRQLRREAT